MNNVAETAPNAHGLKVGTPVLKSVGPLTFGRDRILFVADNAAAIIFAIDVGAGEPAGGPTPLTIADLDAKLGAYLGCPREQVFIRDMAVHPRTHELYLAVMRGLGTAAVPVLLRVTQDGTFSVLDLRGVPYASTRIDDAPGDDDARLDGRVVQGTREGESMEPRPGWKLQVARDPLRTATVTDMAFVDGALLVAGASNQEFSSTLRRIPFPFNGNAASSSLEIFHVSHAKYESASPIRSFVSYNGDSSILASYTCTPVVHFSVKDLAPGVQLKGQTVAELGAGNTPLDMVAYSSRGESALLVSNTRYPLMKLKAADIDRQEALTQPREPVGVPPEMLPHEGVSRLANLGNDYIVMLQMDRDEKYHVNSYAVGTL